MSRVMSLRLQDSQIERLNRAARRLGRTPSETAAILLEEALRQREFAFIEFRDSPVGRQAYLQGTRLTVWQIEWLARVYGRDVDRVAEHLSLPPVQVAAALHYAEAYPQEVEDAINDNEWAADNIQRLIPGIEIYRVGEVST
ncbi:MAG: CopG family transcriptional regulator [Dehalococcoidia bacterium]|nr:CopG family transcriptional regulator [Dehalococcoidia bacterium]